MIAPFSMSGFLILSLGFGFSVMGTGCAADDVTPALVSREGPPSPVAVAATQLVAGGAIEAPVVASPGLARPEAPGSPITLSGEPADLELQTGQEISFDAAIKSVEDRQRVFQDADDRLMLDGDFVQGGLVFGAAPAGSRITLDGDAVMVDDAGRFVVGFGRDHGSSALLVLNAPDGSIIRRAFDVRSREFEVDRIDGLPQSKVSGFTEAQLKKINVDSEKKKSARSITQSRADWATGFSWPATGRISGVFGSQRILNGEPKRPHSGVDVAAPTGTAIRAPAAGVVTLAENDMYFEGGLVLLDHGQWLESAFLHMSRIDVEPGQRVEKGEVLGAVGATGRVTGPHLHWSIKWQGTLVDPQLLAGDMATNGPVAP